MTMLITKGGANEGLPVSCVCVFRGGGSGVGIGRCRRDSRCRVVVLSSLSSLPVLYLSNTNCQVNPARDGL